MYASFESHIRFLIYPHSGGLLVCWEVIIRFCLLHRWIVARVICGYLKARPKLEKGLDKFFLSYRQHLIETRRLISLLCGNLLNCYFFHHFDIYEFSP